MLGNAGYRVNHRMDVGLEVFWVPMGTAQGTIRTTHFDAVAQFRPWASQGFFMKGGAGMAYVRNWVDTISSESINSKALSVVIGAGWEFKPLQRFGFQIFGSQHVAAHGRPDHGRRRHSRRRRELLVGWGRDRYPLM